MGYVIGLDPSITATGVCVMHDNKPPKFSTEGTKSGEMDFAKRLWHLRCAIWTNVPPNTQPLLAVIETPLSPLALGKHGGAGYNNNIMAYAMCYELFGMFSVPYVEVAPTQLKLVATGKGNATKDEVGEAFDRNCQVIAKDDNQRDAYWLAMIGWELLATRPNWANRPPYGGWLDLDDRAYDLIEGLQIKNDVLGRYT